MMGPVAFKLPKADLNGHVQVGGDTVWAWLGDCVGMVGCTEYSGHLHNDSDDRALCDPRTHQKFPCVCTRKK